MSSQPTRPFEVTYVQAKPGERQQPSKWSVPFDTNFRDLELPNSPEGAFPGYASIGWHVTQNALKYCPAYKILETLNLRRGVSPTAMSDWEKRTEGGLLVTDRRSGVVTWLSPSVSVMEAIISWFVKENGHEGLVLCNDRTEKVWYVEPQRPELIVWLGEDGSEVAQGEGGQAHYLIDKHPNALMSAGE